MKIYLIAGEQSGDILGSELMDALRADSPKVEFFGAGGDRMRANGQRQCLNLAEHAVIGIFEALMHLPKFLGFMAKLISDCVAVDPDAIVLIDAPGFNLRFLKNIRAKLPKRKIFYYVSPQLWAWKPERAKILEDYADALLCIFPFEPAWYRQRAPRLKVVNVGHPLLDRVFLPQTDGRPSEKTTIALLPGSRWKEIRKHLPILLQTAGIMATSQQDLSFICLAPNPETAEVEARLIEKEVGLSIDIQVLEGYSSTYLSRCHLAFVASGTATLECAIAGTPMIVFYTTSPITYMLGKMLIKVPYIAMVNLLLNKLAVPEMIQGAAEPQKMARAAIELLNSRERRMAQQEDIKKAVSLLGEPGASVRAAKTILSGIAAV